MQFVENFEYDDYIRYQIEKNLEVTNGVKCIYRIPLSLYIFASDNKLKLYYNNLLCSHYVCFAFYLFFFYGVELFQYPLFDKAKG